MMMGKDIANATQGRRFNISVIIYIICIFIFISWRHKAVDTGHNYDTITVRVLY